jgi:hypothetical protein
MLRNGDATLSLRQLLDLADSALRENDYEKATDLIRRIFDFIEEDPSSS